MCAGVQCASARRRSAGPRRGARAGRRRRRAAAGRGAARRARGCASGVAHATGGRGVHRPAVRGVSARRGRRGRRGVRGGTRRGLRRRSPRGPRRARAPADADRQPRDVRGGGSASPGADTRLARQGSGTEVFASRLAPLSSRSPGTISSRFERRPRARSPRSAPRPERGRRSDARFGVSRAARDDVWPCGAPSRRRSSRCPCVTSGAFERSRTCSSHSPTT